MGVAWRDLTYGPTGNFASVAVDDRALDAVMQPGGVENPLTAHDVDRLQNEETPWPSVRRGPSARIVPVRDRGFRAAGRKIMALLVAGDGPRRRTIAIDRFEMSLIEAAERARPLRDLLRDSLARESRTPDQTAASLRRLASVGALLANWPAGGAPASIEPGSGSFRPYSH